MTFRAPLVWRQPTDWRPQHETNNPNLLTSTLAPVGAVPFRQQDWPNPQYRFTTQEFVQQRPLPIGAKPFAQLDWQNSTVSLSRDIGFTNPGIVTATPAAQPFFNPDFGAQPWRVGPHDTVFPNLLLTTLVPVTAPFFQTQWDNPQFSFGTQDTMNLNVTITLPPGPPPAPKRRSTGLREQRMADIRRDDEELMMLATVMASVEVAR